MKGILSSATGDHPIELRLPKSDAVLGQGQDGSWVATEGTAALPVLKFAWDRRHATWRVHEIGHGPLVNGAAIPEEGVRLADGDLLRVGEWSFRFRKEMDAPILGGSQTVDRVDLVPGQELLIGRETGSGEPNKLGLDGDDLSVSKSHLRVFRSSSGWVAEDLSKTGTELNGRLFGESPLVYGDRLRIANYLFEFGGDHLQRIDHLDAGTLRAHEVVVEVPDRLTGKPLRILDGVSLEIKTGEFIGILGGSGQGKSTLLNALCGIRPGTSGKVTIGGVPVEELIRTRPGSIGYVPQDDIVHPELTVTQAFQYSARLRLPLKKEEREDLISRTIEVLGLTEHARKKIYQLSGGQRKRVSIGIELLSKPQVLFLDEPSSGLDPATEKSLMELLQALSLTNLTVICTTHVLQNAFLFNRLLFVHGGKLIFAGSAQQAREHFLGSSQSQSVSRSFQSPLEKIYPTVLEGRVPAEEWESKYRASKFWAPVSPVSKQERAREPSRKARGVSALTKLRVLMRRQVSIMTSDWLNVVFLLSQALIIGLLVAWVSDDIGFRMFLGVIAAMWFGCSNGAQQIVGELPILQRERICGLGLNTYISSKLLFQSFVTSVQALLLLATIVVGAHYLHESEFEKDVFLERLDERENPVVIDESASGSLDEFMPVGELDDGVGGDDLALPPSDPAPADGGGGTKEPERKTVPMTGPLTVLVDFFDLEENVLDSGDRPRVLPDFSPLLDDSGKQLVFSGEPVWKVVSVTLGLKIGAFLLVAIVGVGMGLTISALVRTTTQAVMWVPLLLIPQILFGGFVVSLPDMSTGVRVVARFFPSFAGQRLIDVAHLYGRRSPKLTNQTKTPNFLTSSGEKEPVTWMQDDREYTQEFEKLSDVNTSWQNLAVRHDRLGHHEHAMDPGYGGASPTKRETVEARNDVRYEQGNVYRFLNPAWVAALTLAGWLLLGLAVIQAGLRLKR